MQLTDTSTAAVELVSRVANVFDGIRRLAIFENSLVVHGWLAVLDSRDLQGHPP